MKVLFTFLLLATILLVLDFTLGRKQHLASLKRKPYPFYKSHIDVFASGPQLFQDFFSELREAQKHIHVLFYIVKDDSFSIEFIDILKQKASEGVEVRLLLDWLGSYKAKKKLQKLLEHTGVELAFAHPPKLPFLFYSLNTRNHRKITVIDGTIGYLGGFNIGKEYINQDAKLCPWRDYHLKLKGEGVKALQQVFLQDWGEGAKLRIQHTDVYFPPLKKGPYRHQLIPSEGFYIEETFSALIRNAQQKIMIGTPYFIPGKRVFEDLQHALKRGVKLEILVPNKADHPFVKEASYKYLRTLISLGATVFQYKKGFYHAKVLIVDDTVCDIGTANFDRRSFYLNHEFNCYTYDKKYIKQVRELLQKDQSEAKIAKIEDLKSPIEVIARILSPFL